jgi:hypothetical protein
MSFCSAFDNTCANAKCRRAVTPAVQEAANAWWGGWSKTPAPIAYMNLSKGCPDFMVKQADPTE